MFKGFARRYVPRQVFVVNHSDGLYPGLLFFDLLTSWVGSRNPSRRVECPTSGMYLVVIL